jgi:tRNA (guanine37-N1)-methyltransferase
MLTIKIPLKHIERMRKILMEKEIIARNYKILTENNYGYIALNQEISKKLQNQIKKELNKDFKEEKNGSYEANKYLNEQIPFEIVEKNLEKLKKEPKSMTEQLNGKLNKKQIENLKTSFDIIGDVVVLEIPEDLIAEKDIIGEATLNFTKRKAIFMKKSAIEGVTRTRQIEHIAGENTSETIHKEYGGRLKLDIKKVYFSPRLATERKRVADQVKGSENILDMFSGIGPFPILIARNHNANIYSVDINKEAIKYMQENIRINKLKGNIIPILGDINEIAETKFKHENIKFDRIIMNLPGTAKDFLNLAVSLINDNGIIHYYEFSDDYESAIKRIKRIAKSKNKAVEILNTRKVKSSSPGQWHIVIDAKISTNN